MYTHTYIHTCVQTFIYVYIYIDTDRFTFITHASTNSMCQRVQNHISSASTIRINFQPKISLNLSFLLHICTYTQVCKTVAIKQRIFRQNPCICICTYTYTRIFYTQGGNNRRGWQQWRIHNSSSGTVLLLTLAYAYARTLVHTYYTHTVATMEEVGNNGE